MAGYVIEEVTVTNGNIVTIGKDDIMVGLLADGSKIIILRFNRQR